MYEADNNKNQLIRRKRTIKICEEYIDSTRIKAVYSRNLKTLFISNNPDAKSSKCNIYKKNKKLHYI